MTSNQQLDSTTSNSGGRDSPGTATSTAKSSRRDSLTDKIVIPTQSPPQMQVPKATAFEIPANSTNRRLVRSIPCNLQMKIFELKFYW